MLGHGTMTSQEVQGQAILLEIADYCTLEGDIDGDHGETSFDYFRSELTCMTPPLTKPFQMSRSRSGQSQGQRQVSNLG